MFRKCTIIHKLSTSSNVLKPCVKLKQLHKSEKQVLKGILFFFYLGGGGVIFGFINTWFRYLIYQHHES